MIAHPGIERRHPPHRRVQRVEQLVSDARRDLGAVAEREGSSCAISTRLVFSTDSRIASQSYGASVRRSIISMLTSCRRLSTCVAACSDFCTSAPYVITRQARARLHHARLAERNREVRARMRRPVVRLAVELLVLQEQHRVVAAHRRAQQPAGIQRVRRHHHAQSRNVREHRLRRTGCDRSRRRSDSRRSARESPPDSEKPPFDRQRSVASSSRICIIAGQM